MDCRRKRSSFGRILLLMLAFLCLMLTGAWLFSSCGGAVGNGRPAGTAVAAVEPGVSAPAATAEGGEPENDGDVIPEESDFDGANNEVVNFAE